MPVSMRLGLFSAEWGDDSVCGASRAIRAGQDDLAPRVMLGELLRAACFPEAESPGDRDDEPPRCDLLRERAEALGVGVGDQGGRR